MKINCIICKKEVQNPKINQVTCGRKKCTEKYGREVVNLVRNTPEGKEYAKNYRDLPDVKERKRKYMEKLREDPEYVLRSNVRFRALTKLKNKHPREFKKIFNQEIIVSQENKEGNNSNKNFPSPPNQIIKSRRKNK